MRTAIILSACAGMLFLEATRPWGTPPSSDEWRAYWRQMMDGNVPPCSTEPTRYCIPGR